jgi:demethylmenaquinone methyltransferase/2-methoxy-6-polyprenyl-1,4-benzoquinol methylase
MAQDHRHEDEYARIAPLYDCFLTPWILPVRHDIARLVHALRPVRVLDLCCGTGQQARLLARRGVQVAGVDSSPAMLARAMGEGPAAIHCFLADAAHLPFAGASFDAVVISLALHEKDAVTRARIMSEAKRVLAPGGNMVLMDFCTPITPAARFAHLLVRVVERFAGRSHHRHFHDFMQSGALEGLVVEHALTVRVATRRFLGTALLAVAQPA